MASLDSVPEDGLLHILQYAAPLASARLGLTSKRWADKILSCEEDAQNSSSPDDDGRFSQRLWRSFAVDRWGSGVCLDGDGDANEADRITWYQYYRHRSSSVILPSHTSPLDLIQEYYAQDPYRLLTSCILCSRTSGGPLIRQVVHYFLETYPTPTDVVNADISIMRDELNSLGLNREKIMKRFAAGFLGNWTEVTELHGCGAFASSSFDVFCRGNHKKVLRDKKADRNVKAYASYLKRLWEGSEEEGGGGSAEREAKSKVARKTAKKRKLPKQRTSLPVRRMTRNRKHRAALR